MPKKRKAAEKSDVDRVTVLLPAELKARLDSETERGMRSFSDVLREYLSRGLASQETYFRLPPWPSAIGQLIGLLAENIARHAQSPDEALNNLKVAAPALFDELVVGMGEVLGSENIDELNDADEVAANEEGRWLGRQVLEAHVINEPDDQSVENLWARAARQVVEKEIGASQDELIHLQNALLLSPEALEKLKILDSQGKG